MERDAKIFGEIYLDTDSDPKVNKGSDYTLNTIIQADGRFGVVINVKGNEIVTDQSLLNSVIPNPFSQPIKVVGSCVDEARNRVIYFLANYINISNSYVGAILYYDITTGENKSIIYGDYIGLTYDTVVTAGIIGDLLVWADGDYVKEVNYIRAYNYTNTISTTYKYSIIDSNTIRFYKKPYDGNINVAGNVGGSKLLAGRSFQFAIRYIYNNYEKSVISQISDIIWCDASFLANGKGDITSYDTITASFTIPSNKDIFKTELYVRNNESSNWYLYDVIESTGSISYSFDNSKLPTSVDQEEITRPYDSIPKTAKTLEIIEKDKLLVGDISENFNPVSISADVSIITKSTGWPNPIKNSTLYFRDDGTYLYFTLNTFTPNSSFVVLHIPLKTFIRSTIPNPVFPSILFLPITKINNFIPGTGDIFLVYNATASSTIKNVMTFFFNQLSGIFKPSSIYGTWHVELGNFDGKTNCIWMNKIVTLQNPSDYNGNDSAVQLGLSMDSYLPTTSIPTVKNADSYLVGVVYFDEDLRFSSINKISGTINTTQNGVFSTPANFRVSIKNLPPEWAYYYTLAFTKRTKVDYFIQLLVQSNDFFWGEDGYLRIRVQNIINMARDMNHKCTIPSYIWENGDRIRILMDKYTDSTFDIIGEEFPQDDHSYEKDNSTGQSYILDANGNKIYNTSSSFIVVAMKTTDVLSHGGAAVNFSEFSIEIYRPKKSSDQTFYYHDAIYPITSPGTNYACHTGNIQNQNPFSPITTPAIINSNFGDCYYRLRFAKYVYPVVDENFSDFYISNFNGLKNPNIYNADQKENYYNSGIRYGGSYVENSQINQLNQFKVENLEILKSKFGSVNSLKEVGNVLKVLQDRKETSIYISRTEMQNADGTSNVVKSTSLLGTANIMNEGRGTIFPRSVVVHNRNLYYFDVYRAEVIRSSSNGQYPISEYGMRTYFKAKSKEILSTGIDNCDVIASFDEENKMYLLTFITASNSETIAFYDPELESEKPRWVSFYSFIPEHYQSFGTALLSFKNGLGYKHNSSNVNRATFYGVKYKQQVNWYSNANAIFKKVFKSLAIKSNKAWDVPLIIIEPDATYTRGAQSLLKPNHFSLKEGVYYAPYLNNMLTTSSSPLIKDLINGDNLRGYYLKHQMENMENAEVWLLDGEVNYIPSNYN